jgi:hypothetical protein
MLGADETGETASLTSGFELDVERGHNRRDVQSSNPPSKIWLWALFSIVVTVAFVYLIADSGYFGLDPEFMAGETWRKVGDGYCQGAAPDPVGSASLEACEAQCAASDSCHYYSAKHDGSTSIDCMLFAEGQCPGDTPNGALVSAGGIGAYETYAKPPSSGGPCAKLRKEEQWAHGWYVHNEDFGGELCQQICPLAEQSRHANGRCKCGMGLPNQDCHFAFACVDGACHDAPNGKPNIILVGNALTLTEDGHYRTRGR